MQEVHSFEYAIIRLVPKVEREEFLNVGVILYCKTLQYLHTLVNIDESKIRALSDGIDITELNEHLSAFKQISDGTKTSSPISALDIASRFRWLTATRSTIVQTSKVHPGISDNPEETIRKLFKQYVL
jgi:hypothetical protein